ncbi:MAG TPA: hypothetical protein VHM64_01345, partial [Candidatus Binatia bacterium]|nr:hypothetical protein [Candidatus Binatia bacterium]
TGWHKETTMNELYKGHFIRSGAEPVPDSTRWKPTVEVQWIKAPNEQTKRWTPSDFESDFATEKLAEIEGHLFARQWVDSSTNQWKQPPVVAARVLTPAPR